MKATIRYKYTASSIFPCEATLQLGERYYCSLRANWEDVRAAVIEKAKTGEAMVWGVPPEEEVEV